MNIRIHVLNRLSLSIEQCFPGIKGLLFYLELRDVRVDKSQLPGEKKTGETAVLLHMI